MTRSMAKDASIILTGGVLRMASAFARESAFAYAFGAGPVSDAFIAALALPALVMDFLGTGVGSLLVPYWREHGRTAPEDVIGLLNLLLLALSVIVLAIEWQAPALVHAMNPGLALKTQALSATLARILLIGTLGLFLAAFWSGILRAEARFEVTSLASIPLNLAAAAGFALSQGHGPAWAAAISLAAQILQLAVLWRGGRRIIPRWRPTVRTSQAVLRLLSALPLSLLVVLAGQGGLAVDRYFASSLAPGSLSALNYAYQVISIPAGIVAGSIVTAAYPRLADAGQQRDRTLLDAAGAIFFITLPSVPLLYVAAAPAVSLLFMHGAFSSAAVAFTAAAVRGFALGLPLYPCLGLLIQTAFAKDRVARAAEGAIAGIAAATLADFFLAPRYGVFGIALATSVGQLGGIAVLAWRLWSIRAVRHARRLTRRTWSHGVSALAAAGALTAAARALPGGVLPLAASSLVAAALYLTITGVAGAPEIGRLRTALRRISWRRPSPRPG